MTTHRIISAEAQQQDTLPGLSPLRPRTINEYVGQSDLIEKLRITLQAAKERNESLEHILLHGPPGLGKTTLAHVVGAELGTRVYTTAGPMLTKGTDLVGTLTKLDEREVLFIDEIHRLPAAVEEFIYPAMEDFRIEFTVDSGLHARVIPYMLKPFTLIGATTRAGLLSGPLRSRFGIVHHLRFYEQAELEMILLRSCRVLNIAGIADDAIVLIARRSRGTPRIANRLLRRVRDFAQVRAKGAIDGSVVTEALELEGVDDLGLDELDRAYLRAIGETYRGGPVGLETIAATMNEDSGTLEDVVEPYLLQLGFLARTRQGRRLTHEAARHLDLSIDFDIETGAANSLFGTAENRASPA